MNSPVRYPTIPPFQMFLSESFFFGTLSACLPEDRPQSLFYFIPQTSWLPGKIPENYAFKWTLLLFMTRPIQWPPRDPSGLASLSLSNPCTLNFFWYVIHCIEVAFLPIQSWARMELEETADLAELPMAVWSEPDQLADSTKIQNLSYFFLFCFVK